MSDIESRLADAMADRANAVEALAETFGRLASDLGLEGEVGLRYCPRSRATAREQLEAELRQLKSGHNGGHPPASTPGPN